MILLHERFELWRPPAWFGERLRKEFPGLEVVHFDDAKMDKHALQSADIIIGWELTPEQFRSAKNLRWIYCITADVSGFFFPELMASGVKITNAGRVHGPVVAEHAIAVVMALAKRLPSAMRYQQRKKWAMEAIWAEHPRPRELRGATMTVVGLGCIGSEIASMAAALGMHVVGVRRHIERGTAGAHEVIGFEALDSAIARSDYVVLALPLTNTTRHLINGRRLQCFQPHTYLVNVSRGALADEDALLAALRSGRLAGAALDVFVEEPLPRRSKFWKLPNVLITPHTAFLSDKVWERHYALMSNNLTRYLSGQPVDAVQDPAT